MVKNFLSGFPAPEELIYKFHQEAGSISLNPNNHIHTPYSFSAFDDFEMIFSSAAAEGINVLGINDFYVTDGYDDFHEGAVRNRIFPLFNIEFIGLMREEQKKGIRINDPNNPGRIYFTGKALDYPFHLKKEYEELLRDVRRETQRQLEAMVAKLNELIITVNPGLSLDFSGIKRRYAKELVRERHIAKAVRYMAEENYNSLSEQLSFLEALYGGKKSKAGPGNSSALENEIRSNLLKAGGRAFVEEDENSFIDIKKIISIIIDAGGIPCYPVLLDDPSGNLTEYESDPGSLLEYLNGLGVGAIELIPGRNDHDRLESFSEFFDRKGFVVTFGTEHNTPEMTPLTVTARGGRPLSDKLQQVNTRGIKILAAHQYLKAKGLEGYTGADGRPRTKEREFFESLGRSIIEYYLIRG
jgi:hypothetical protein